MWCLYFHRFDMHYPIQYQLSMKICGYFYMFSYDAIENTGKSNLPSGNCVLVTCCGRTTLYIKATYYFKGCCGQLV